jgi:hypothetical protein
LFNYSFIRGYGLPGPPVLCAGANPEAPLRIRPLPPAATFARSKKSGSFIYDGAILFAKFSTESWSYP